MHKETVTPELLKVLKKLMTMDELSSFRLVGGTAIALQLGHRKSVDIDLFTNQKTDLRKVSKAISKAFALKDMVLTTTHIGVFIDGIRVDIYDDWHIPFHKEPVLEEEIRLSALEDLAAFKLSTIIGRREKKDYIDLYFLFNTLTASLILSTFHNYEPLMSDKSILFAMSEIDTAIANQTPMPDMLEKLDWKEVRTLFIVASRAYMRTKLNNDSHLDN